jgi:ribonuclease HII
MTIYPSFDHEQAFWNHGYRAVAGVDEVGRGAMAGPLVAAAVVLPVGIDRTADPALLSEIRDSKLLNHRRRERILPYIQEIAVATGIGLVEPEEIDAIGVGPANRIAMERAVEHLECLTDALLLDATTIDHALPQVGIIDGDAKSVSIAAASIVAKVARDRIMIAAAEADARYGFEIHKGYCTATHLKAIRLHGPGPLHRRCYAPVADALTRVASCL